MDIEELMGGEGEEGELNLTPYLDIITTLVIFMIFTFQVVIEFNLLEVFMPAYVKSNDDPSVAASPTLTLSLIVNREGFWVFASNGVAPQQIPLATDGKYDFAKLHETLVQWKQDLGLGEAIVLIADDDTQYDLIVETMDAIRSDKGKLLFPDVSLATASAGGPN
ncbi:MAG TPA: biopolymer transporter ExbD [Myxococcota bacterium]|nr:biopolymer transporter ExbD [Myxococcota bacterium]